MTTFWCFFYMTLLNVIHAADSNPFVKACPQYPEPKNGRMICDHLLGQYCTPSCDVGYETSTLPAWAYVCNPFTKRWMTYPEAYPLPWPDCVLKKTRQSKGITKSSQLTNTTHLLSRLDHIAFTQHADNTTKRGNVNNQVTTENNTTSQNKTIPISDLKSITSTLFENTSHALSYQVVEEHENNRTKTNEVDLQNVTYSSVNNNNEIDIDNVTIIATRTKVPNSKLQKSTSKKEVSDSKLKLNGGKKIPDKNVTINDSKQEVIDDKLKLATNKQETPTNKSKVVEASTQEVLNQTNTESLNNKDVQKQSSRRGEADPSPLHIGQTSGNVPHKTKFKKSKSTVPKKKNKVKSSAMMFVIKALNNKIEVTPVQETTLVQKTYIPINSNNENLTTPEINLVESEKTQVVNQTENNSAAVNQTAITIQSPENNNTTSDTPQPANETSGKISKVISLTQTDPTENSTSKANNETVSNNSVTNTSNANNNVTKSQVKTHTDGINVLVQLKSNNITNSVNDTGVINTNVVKNTTEINKEINHQEKASESKIGKEKEEVSASPSSAKVTIDNKTNTEMISTTTGIGKLATETINATTGVGKLATETINASKAVGKLSTETINATIGVGKNDAEQSKTNVSIILKEDVKHDIKEKANLIVPNDRQSLTKRNKTVPDNTDEMASITIESLKTKLHNMIEARKNTTFGVTKKIVPLVVDKKSGFAEKKKKLKAPPLLVPVFSEKDLNLLRHMVAGSGNSKRSELRHSYSSLWNKMLSLASKRDGNTEQKAKLATHKQLAYRDTSVARFIMSHVNKNADYKFHDSFNPFLNGLKHDAFKQSSFKEVNPNTRHYVWNGATYVMENDESKEADSYLNSKNGGGLTDNSNYKWNGATFVPNDEPEKSKTKFPTDITNKEVQTILDMWNGGASKSILKASDLLKSDTSNPASPDGGVPNLQSINNKQTNPYTTAPQKSDSEDQYYSWNGDKYEPITPFSNLPQGTIKYKHDGLNKYEPIGQIPFEPYNPLYSAPTENSMQPTQSQINPYKNDPKEKERPSTTELPVYYPGSTSVKEKDTSATIDGSVVPDAVTNAQVSNPLSTSSEPDSRSAYSTNPTLSSQTDKLPNNAEYILQSHYPSSAANDISNNNNQRTETTTQPAITETTPQPLITTTTTTPTPTTTITTTTTTTTTNQVVKGEKQTEDPFNARINYPTPFQDRKEEKLQNEVPPHVSVDLNFNLQKQEGISNIPTAKILINKTPDTQEEVLSKHYINSNLAAPDPMNSYIKKHNNKQKDDNTILLPPDNPYDPDERPRLSTNKQPAKEKQSNSVTILLPKTNPYINNLPKMNTNPNNPFREDAENLQAVIENDLRIKGMLESLSKIYEHAPGSMVIKVPFTQTKSSSESTSPSLDQELKNDLKDRSPDFKSGEKDIEDADQVLENEEDKQRFANSDAMVKTNDEMKDVEKTKSNKLKVILQNTKDDDSNNDDKNNLDILNRLSGKQKGELESTLQQDMAKLKSGNIGLKSDEKTKNTGDLMSLASSQEKPNTETFSGLSVSDIRNLLKLTKMAERESVQKKHGLATPNSSTENAMSLLEQPNIRNFMKYLITRSATKKDIDGSKHITRQDKKKIYKEALTKLLSKWTKQYEDIALKKKNPLPKFTG